MSVQLKKKMEKKIDKAFGKYVFLLGMDHEGTYYWLEQPTFDCGWYWGLGYVETYTNNRYPHLAKDINSHQHFDGLFLKGDAFKNFKEFFAETPLDDDEIWQLLELMQTAYTARKYSDMLHTGGSHFTTNWCKEDITNTSEYERINKSVIPKVMTEVCGLLINYKDFNLEFKQIQETIRKEVA